MRSVVTFITIALGGLGLIMTGTGIHTLVRNFSISGLINVIVMVVFAVILLIIGHTLWLGPTPEPKYEPPEHEHEETKKSKIWIRKKSRDKR